MHAGAVHPEAAGDLALVDAFGDQPMHFIGLGAGGRCPALVFAGLLGGGGGTPFGAVFACRPLRPAQGAFHQYDIDAPGFIA